MTFELGCGDDFDHRTMLFSKCIQLTTESCISFHIFSIFLWSATAHKSWISSFGSHIHPYVSDGCRGFDGVWVLFIALDVFPVWQSAANFTAKQKKSHCLSCLVVAFQVFTFELHVLSFVKGKEYLSCDWILAEREQIRMAEFFFCVELSSNCMIFLLSSGLIEC